MNWVTTNKDSISGQSLSERVTNEHMKLIQSRSQHHNAYKINDRLHISSSYKIRVSVNFFFFFSIDYCNLMLIWKWASHAGLALQTSCFIFKKVQSIHLSL
ncbi:hypothetical protein NE237_012998 [Protea cynaroides]|uniref:Uncharacterized protein n=1 Tax=Protea cynaroides TaxID=273540 RepID=A0A9Q0H171_9MAGN|nr:hypothetical protein NE237_012998 [Protea cynaroides]